MTHPGTTESREYPLETPTIFTEIAQFAKFQQEEATANEASKQAAKRLTLKKIGNDDQFTSYEDGTVLDTRTGLMWAAKDNGSNINWANAKSYCENYRDGGYSGWRMPTQDELAGLYDAAQTYKSDCGYDVHLTELIRLSCYWAWASAIRGSDAALFDFRNGAPYWSRQSSGTYYRALPVRFGK